MSRDDFFPSSPVRWGVVLLTLVLGLQACSELEDLTTPPSPDGGGKTRAGPEGVEALGAQAEALLSASTPKVHVDVDVSEGRSLTQRARDALAENLSEHGKKSSVTFSSGSAPSQDEYSLRDLIRIESNRRETDSTDERIAIHVLVLDGRYERKRAIGVAFTATAFAIFPEQLEGRLLPNLNYDRYEEAVVVHELGHLFGLVNITGKGSFHEDPDHPNHSENEDSVMHWAVEDVRVGELEGGPPTEFDADDREEMSRIRG